MRSRFRGATALVAILVGATSAHAEDDVLNDILASTMLREGLLFPRGLTYTLSWSGKAPATRITTESIWFQGTKWAVIRRSEGPEGKIERGWFYDGNHTYIVHRKAGTKAWFGRREPTESSIFYAPFVSGTFWIGHSVLSKHLRAPKARIIGEGNVAGTKCVVVHVRNAQSLHRVYYLDPERLYLPLRVVSGVPVNSPRKKKKGFNPPRRKFPGGLELLVVSDLIVGEVRLLGPNRWVPLKIAQQIQYGGTKGTATLSTTKLKINLDPKDATKFLGDYWIHDVETDTYIGTENGRKLAPPTGPPRRG